MPEKTDQRKFMLIVYCILNVNNNLKRFFITYEQNNRENRSFYFAYDNKKEIIS